MEVCNPNKRGIKRKAVALRPQSEASIDYASCVPA